MSQANPQQFVYYFLTILGLQLLSCFLFVGPGAAFCCGTQASHCSLSCWGAPVLGAGTSVTAGCGLSSCFLGSKRRRMGLVALGACGIFLTGRWDSIHCATQKFLNDSYDHSLVEKNVWVCALKIHILKKNKPGSFHVSVKILGFHCCGSGSVPSWGLSLQVEQLSKKKNPPNYMYYHVRHVYKIGNKNMRLTMNIRNSLGVHG